MEVEQTEKPLIGVLALQGDFDAHREALQRAGARARQVRTAVELNDVDALIIPGGESTTMLKLLDYENLFEPLRRFASEKPVFGTCAGAILMASEVVNPPQPSLSLLDMTVERNGYGRQIDSRIAQIELKNNRTAEAVFIRAPIIRRISPDTNVLATYLNAPVLVEQGKHLAATFHPELNQADNRIHSLFVEKVKAGAGKKERTVNVPAGVGEHSVR
ncbi:MAG TPA: pyridoxal 5'-phosphate synthase glutaminase subunit PdxT [Bryobacteraceae bacterium]|nr:pyridoxal 5'-phosphate synthase glutaminase subunit PdxT [Bryobacteraceae bacterium]